MTIAVPRLIHTVVVKVADQIAGGGDIYRVGVSAILFPLSPSEGVSVSNSNSVAVKVPKVVGVSTAARLVHLMPGTVRAWIVWGQKVGSERVFLPAVKSGGGRYLIQLSDLREYMKKVDPLGFSEEDLSDEEIRIALDPNPLRGVQFEDEGEQ